LHNGYELDIFNILAEFANPSEIRSLIGSQSKLTTKVLRKLRLTKEAHFVERDFFFNPSFFHIKKSTYLDGYWQSYHYPQSCETEIRHELTFRSPPKGLNYEISEHIKKVNSVSVHVRRGDYISNPTFSSVHGFVGIDYYNKAIEKVRDRVLYPHFFVFSDDIEWVKNNLTFDNKTIFISHNSGRSSYEDMRLMSMCKNNIIANSSFSWWAAWLNANQSKVVIAPENWLVNRSVVPYYDKFIDSLFPDDWIII
jgi:Glycosyl transferase family 11